MSAINATLIPLKDSRAMMSQTAMQELQNHYKQLSRVSTIHGVTVHFSVRKNVMEWEYHQTGIIQTLECSEI